MTKKIKIFTLMALLLLPLWSVAANFADCRHLTVTDGLLNNQVRQLVELPNGQMFVATEGRFSLYNGREFVPQPYNLDSVYTLPAFGGHSYFWQGDSLLWLKDFYSLYMYDVRTRQFRYDYERRMGQEDLRRFVTERDDSVMRAKIEALNPMRPHFDSLVAGTSLRGRWLQAYVQDRQGGQWMGIQDGGILYVPPRRPVARLFSPVEGETIHRIVAIDHERVLLTGVRGIYEYDRSGQCVVQTLATGDIDSQDATIDARGRIWVCSHQGLYCYDHGVLTNYNARNVPTLPHWHVRFALPLSDGRLLVCILTNKLGYLYPDEYRFEPLDKKLPALEHYRTIVAAQQLTRQEEVAVCTQNGLFILNTTKDTLTMLEVLRPYSQYSQKFNCIWRDVQGRMWLGTQDGLLVWTADGMRRIAQADGLSNACIQSIVEDNRGRLWIGTSCGINRLRLDGNQLQILSLGTSDGLPQVEMSERGACMMADGTAWFATRERLVAFQTADYEQAPKAMPVVLVGVNRHQNYATLHFSALNYAAPEHVVYRYRLRGLEKEWNHAIDDHGLAEANYKALPAGTYTFEVQASIAGSDWGNTTEYTFVIHPPLWITWWAKLLYVLVILTIFIYGLNTYLKRRKTKMERENEAKVNHLFELRDEARHQFAQNVNIEPEKITINKEEEQLVKQMMKAIGQNMDNCDYTVATDIGMSRASLYKKTSQILGITPNDFLRNVRLKHAAQLLAETQEPVNQISLMVGFPNSRYFSQCFKKMFGINPIEYRDGILG